MTKRLQILHHDRLLRQSLADQVSAHGFAVDNGDGAGVDLVIADADAFAGGTEAFGAWAGTRGCPVLLLIPSSDAVRWLSVGAAACLAKPVRLAELLRAIDRLVSIADSARPSPPQDLQLSAPRREIVDRTGHRWPLTEKETAILAYLHAAGARAVPREELLESVWGYANDASTHTVETHIYRLRQKLAQSPGGANLLTTEAGGYRLSPDLVPAK